MTTRKSRLQKLKQFKAGVTDAYGEGHMVTGKAIPWINRIPTGSLQLDLLLGGGFPIGKFALLWGWESTGKTTAGLLGIAAMQRMCNQCYKTIQPRAMVPAGSETLQLEKWRKGRLACVDCQAPYHKDMRPPLKASDYFLPEEMEGVNGNDKVCIECGCVDSIVAIEVEDEWVRDPVSCECGKNMTGIAMIVDLEGTFDPDWSQKLGVDLDAVHIERPDYGEQALDIIENAIAEGIVDIILVDSFANMSMSEDLQKSHEDGKRPTGALALNRHHRNLPYRLNKGYRESGVQTTVIGIQQVRDKVSMGFGGGGHTMFGGHAQRFATSTLLKFTSKKGEVNEMTGGGRKGQKEFLGAMESVELRVEVTKNKTAPTQGRSGTVKLVTADHGILRAGEIDDYDLTYKQGRACDVIEHEKKTGYSVKSAAIGHMIWKNKGDLMIAMHEEPHIKREIQAAIIKRVFEDWGALREQL